MPIYSTETYYFSVEDFLLQNNEYAIAVKRKKLTVTRSLKEISS